MPLSTRPRPPPLKWVFPAMQAVRAARDRCDLGRVIAIIVTLNSFVTLNLFVTLNSFQGPFLLEAPELCMDG